MMVGAYLFGHSAGIVQFVLIALVFTLIPDRKGHDRSGLTLRKQRCVGAGVDPSRKEHSNGNIADFSVLDRGPQFIQQSGGDVILRPTDKRVGVIPHVPVAMFCDRAIFLDAEPRAAWK